MNRYKIKQSSPWLFVATLLLTIFTGIILLLILTKYQIIPKGHPLIFILCFTPIMILAFYFPKFIAVAEIEISFNDEGLQKKWLTQFVLHNKKDIKIKWSV